MKIDYSLTLKEYLRYHGLPLRRQPFAIYSLIAGEAMALLTPWALDYYINPMLDARFPPYEIKHYPMLDAIPIVATPLALAFFIPLVWLLSRRQLLEIDKEGVALKVGWNKLRSPWSAINRVDQDDDYIYIGSKGLSFGKMLLASSTDATFQKITFAMLPKRVFSSAAEAQAFFGQATDYWEEAVGRPVEASGGWPPAPTRPKR